MKKCPHCGTVIQYDDVLEDIEFWHTDDYPEEHGYQCPSCDFDIKLTISWKHIMKIEKVGKYEM